VVIFNENLSKVAEQYLRKGSKVYIEGQLQTRKMAGPAGQERYSTEIVLQRFRGELTILDSRGGGGVRGRGGRGRRFLPRRRRCGGGSGGGRPASPSGARRRLRRAAAAAASTTSTTTSRSRERRASR
jgi:single-strand DNA-binding protein